MYGLDITIHLATLRQDELRHSAARRRTTRTVASGLARRLRHHVLPASGSAGIAGITETTGRAV